MKATNCFNLLVSFCLLIDTGRSQFLNGALVNSCVSLGEEGYSAQPSFTNPFVLSASRSLHTTDNTYAVTLLSVTQASFLAIIIQARLQTGSSEPIGQFVHYNSTLYRELACSENSDGTVTNVDYSTKFLPVTFQWEPPEFNGDFSIIFVATVVIDLGILWQSFQSPSVMIDVTPPTISNCPSSISIFTAPGVNEYAVSWTEPSASDNSGISLIYANHQPGDAFPVGESTVFYQFTDGDGNSATCVFAVTILTDNSPPVISNCPSDIVTSVELGQPGKVLYWTEPTASDLGVVLLVSRSAFPSMLFPVGVTTVVYEFRDGVGNSANCTFMVNIHTVDTRPPTISSCPSKTVAFVELGMEGRAVGWTEPTASDLGGATLKYRSNTPLAFFPVGETTVVYIFSDSSGNEANCTFLLCVLTNDTTPPTISGCPADIIAVVELGQSAIVVNWTEPSASDLGGTSLEFRSSEPSDFFPVGATFVFYIFSDSSNNTAHCTFTVFVLTEDTTPPTISDCPTGITIVVELGEIGGVVAWIEPSASDLGGATLESSSYAPFDFFLVGETSVMYIFSDDSGNKANCTFIVSVRTEDTIPPTINSCPADIIISVELVQTEYEVTWIEPTASDLGGVTLVFRNYIPSDFFPVGETSVVYVFSDISGNTATCTFIVSVLLNETTPPHGICPLDIVVSADAGITGSLVYWTEPTTLDHVDPLLISQTHESGTFFLLGETTVMYTFSDSSGDMATCTFIVSVITDKTLPSPPNCPAEHLMMSVPSGSTSAVVTFPNATCTDAVQGKIIATCIPASSTRFAVGNTVVTCTCRDTAGLQSQCSFIVQVNDPDQTLPVISGCPMGSVASFPENLVCTGADDGILQLVCNPSAKNVFISGIDTPVICFCRNNESESAVCHFNIHPVKENTGPVISGCPPNRVNIFPEDLICADGNDLSLQLICNPSPENAFSPAIDTPVICFCKDNQNVSSACHFHVHPDSVEFVSPTCPESISVVTCSEVSPVTWSTPTEFHSLEESGLTVLSTAQSGNKFRTGVTKVTYIFENVTDILGKCSFEISVEKPDNCGSTTTVLLVSIIFGSLIFTFFVCLFIIRRIRSGLFERNADEQDFQNRRPDRGIDV